MKRAYQIDERKGIDRFRSYLNTNPGNIQLALPLADLAQRLRRCFADVIRSRTRAAAVDHERRNLWLSQQNGMARWGTAPGSVIIHGQKAPVHRPRLRDQAKEAKLGSYELFQHADHNGSVAKIPATARRANGGSVAISADSRWEKT